METNNALPTMPIIYTIGIAVVTLLIGWAIGFLDRKRTDKKSDSNQQQMTLDLESFKQRAQELANQNRDLQERLTSAQAAGGSSLEAEARIQLLQTQVDSLQAQLTQRPAIPQAEGASPLRVQQVLGLWQVFLDGKSIRPETINADERARLMGIIVQMRPWLDAKAAPPPALPIAQVAPVAPVAPIVAPVASPRPQTPPVIPVSSKPAPVVPVQVNLRAAFSPKPAASLPPLLSIVSMIDDILQADIANTPLAATGLRLESGPDGAVMVVVGDRKYDGVDAVPDPTIRAAIQQAITKFNR